jgi:hypothetical protein
LMHGIGNAVWVPPPELVILIEHPVDLLLFGPFNIYLPPLGIVNTKRRLEKCGIGNAE